MVQRQINGYLKARNDVAYEKLAIAIEMDPTLLQIRGLRH